MDEVTYQAFKEKLDTVTLQNKKLIKANTNLKSQNRHLRRVIKNLKDDPIRGRLKHGSHKSRRSSNQY